MIRTVMEKETLQIVRDGRLRLLGGLIVILAFAALAFGAQQTWESQEAREHARERASDQWESQGDKNPHVAAHYGTHVFAPTSVVTAIDPGVSAYLGRSIKMEAHKRNIATHASAEEGAKLSLLGGFSVASVLLELVPLLIIALGHGLWSSERESGTLRQLLSVGIKRETLFWGKICALGSVVLGLLLPAAVAVVAVLWVMGGGDATTLVRLLIMGLGYLVYFAIFGCLTLWASALSQSSRAALVIMVGLWGAVVLVVPRLASEVALVAKPLPSEAQLSRHIGKALEKGVDGKLERDVAVEAIISDLMAEQNLSNTGMLVQGSEIQGVELRAEAQWEDMIHDHFLEDLQSRIAAQEALVQGFGVVSPFVAMRSLSAGLAGTDYAHHRDFSQAAENWRKLLVGQLNKDFAENAGDDGWDYKAGAELWQKIPPFQYEMPSLALALKTHAMSLVILALWLILAIAMARRAASRVRVVG